MVAWRRTMLILSGLLTNGVSVALADAFIESEISPQHPYVQQQVHYQIRLYREDFLLPGDFVDREIADVIVETVVEQDPVTVTRDGRRYQVIERRYLLFPQRSGLLRLPAPLFSGSREFIEGEPLELRVRPPPKVTAAGFWLPALSLTLHEQWNGPRKPWRVGDQIERIITSEALGLTGPQLPSLPRPESPHFRILGGQVQTRTEIVDTSALGQRVERQRFILQQAGEAQVPALTVNWWNLQNGQSAAAVLPAHRIFIAPPLDPPQSVSLTHTPSEDRQSMASAQQEPEKMRLPAGLALTLVVLGCIFLFGILLGPRLAGWLEQQRRHRLTLREFRRACQSQDPQAAARALRQWAEHSFQLAAPCSLGMIAARFSDPRQIQAIWALDAACFGKAATDWDGPACCGRLTPAFRRVSRAIRNRTRNEPLPSL